ncbi:MAG: DUF3618 domain-containing protein [Nocardioides sp.]|jgi:hypothetical protein|uniref:DUF3618 domain-containing protein n=1 Tax=Nocardioides nematodiphilus TaxID=2849669 RepID=UPI001CD9E40B|nr:DUF3618 domain-containing protein [Nocardioides nematodiphilus]MCA1983585.1 DUF3618 domain-containing protein [Nocardioides nematodiphilus]
MAKADRNSALEREIEETRERLSGTIDQLVYRANPKTIASRQAAAVKAVYVDPQTGQPNTANIGKTAGGILVTVVLFVALRKLAKRS